MNRTSAISAPSQLGEKQSETFHDWMRIHKLDEQTVDRYLYVATGFAGTRLNPRPEISGPELSKYEVRQVWNLVAQAMESFFPEQRKILHEVRDHTKLIVNSADSPAQGRSYTYHPEREPNPVVSIEFRNEPIDFLAVAHEFGHCVQLRATHDDFIPPMYREVGAFLGELVFLRYLAASMPVLHLPLADAWYCRNAYYLGKCSAKLREAKSSEFGPYEYEWNYPAARVFSCMAFDEMNYEQVWALYSNLRSIVESMDAYMVSTAIAKNFGLMPPICPVGDSFPAYRLLGIATLLEIRQESRSASQHDVGDFYSKKRKSMEKCKVMVDLDHLLRPVSISFDGLSAEDKLFASRKTGNEQQASNYDLDIYTSLGIVLELLSRSEYHKQQHMVRYIRKNILPAFQYRQTKMYMNSSGVPVAFISWAGISDEVKREIHQIGRSLRYSEWRCGGNIFFNDFIAPYGHVKFVVRDILHNIVPVGAVATGVRHALDGSVRKVNRWTRGKTSAFLEHPKYTKAEVSGRDSKQSVANG